MAHNVCHFHITAATIRRFFALCSRTQAGNTCTTLCNDFSIDTKTLLWCQGKTHTPAFRMDQLTRFVASNAGQHTSLQLPCLIACRLGRTCLAPFCISSW